MKSFQHLLLLLILISNLYLFGCISKIDDQDRLNSTIDFDLSDYMVALQRPINLTHPCTSMVCTRAKNDVWYTNFGLDDWFNDKKNSSLEGSECAFTYLNAKNFTKLEDATSKDAETSWDFCYIDGEKKLCMPRFFMLGSGISSAEFSLGQKYCAGELNMPVIWTIPQESESPATPNPTTLMCHITKSQIPVVVWDSDGKYIDHPSYVNMIKSFNNPDADLPISGPIMITTEALADPYYIDLNGEKKLNITLLNSLATQIRAVDLNCPNCLSVLALKPTFTDSGLPDLCPIEYFLKYRRAEVDYAFIHDPLNCSNKYPTPQMYDNRLAVLQPDLYKKLDLIGVAFNANEHENLTTCLPQKSFSEHLLYSRQVLSNFYTPSVWYSVAMSDGPTKTQICEFSSSTIANAYSDLIRGISGFVSSGVIGVSTHRLVDSPLSGPISCVQKQLEPQVSINTIDQIKLNAQIVFESIQEPLIVDRITSSNPFYVIFESDNSTYVAYLDRTNKISINKTSCQFGLINSNGQVKSNAHYTWFSNCQYYFNDRGPLFRTKKMALSQVVAGSEIYSQDNSFSIFVESINSSNTKEVIFFASTDYLSGRFSAQQDGDSLIIYDMPRTPSYQQPILFSTNSAGASCNAFDASKMFYRSSITQIHQQTVQEIPLVQDKEIKADIAMSQCSNCLSYLPMPLYFCQAEQYLEDNKANFKSKGWSSTLKINEGTCTQYPEMENAFMQQSFDSVLMRTIGAGESGLGNGIDDGENAPACQMSSVSKSNNRCGGTDSSDMDNLQSKHCSVSTLISKATNIENSGKKVCAMGVFQCIDAPTYSYNPFDTFDSAELGTKKFKNVYEKALNSLNNLKSKNPNIDLFNLEKGGISESEFEWYAAWLGAYHYSGMTSASIDRLKAYAPIDENDNVVAYMHRELEELCTNLKQSNPDSICYPHYGTALVIRYNNAIKTCNSGCLHRTC